MTKLDKYGTMVRQFPGNLALQGVYARLFLTIVCVLLSHLVDQFVAPFLFASGDAPQGRHGQMPLYK